ncbi:MAG: AI-2E family transporter, partial [Burkholderiales bacterium]|nr:AI-2E family transporter [Burkholderiales bacterium]
LPPPAAIDVIGFPFAYPVMPNEERALTLAPQYRQSQRAAIQRVAVSYGVMRLFGLEFAALWAVLTGFLNFVPCVGSVLGVVLPGLMTTVQFAIGNCLDPCAMGNSLNLSPFAILVSLAAWSEPRGVPGAFLVAPITAILAIVFSEFPGTRPITMLRSRNGRL